jgi:ribosomal protein L3 glutamine methyltransferase
VFGHGTTNAWDEAVYLALHALQLPLDELRWRSNIRFPRLDAVARCAWSTLELAPGPAAYLTREAWLGDTVSTSTRARPRRSSPNCCENGFAVAARRRIRARSILHWIGVSRRHSRQSFPAIRRCRRYFAPGTRGGAAQRQAYRLHRRVRVLRSDMFSALRGERYDLIIANPPYVSANVMRKLPREYRHEPRVALAGGKDGFDLLRVILRESAQHLTPGGLLVVEVGHKRKQIERLFPHLAFAWPQTSGGDDCVFMLERGDLTGAARAATEAPLRASRAGGGSRPR